MKTRKAGVINASQSEYSAVEKIVGQAGMTLQISFAYGQFRLTAEQQSCVKGWSYGWKALPGKVDVILGGARHTERAGRLRRLHELITLLEQLGVAAKRILPEVDWSEPARMGSLDDAPADTMWIRLSPHPRNRVVALATQPANSIC